MQTPINLTIGWFVPFPPPFPLSIMRGKKMAPAYSAEAESQDLSDRTLFQQRLQAHQDAKSQGDGGEDGIQ